MEDIDKLFDELDGGLGVDVEQLEEETGIDRRKIGEFLHRNDRDYDKVSNKKWKKKNGR